jgi:hypothetical protein
VIDKLLQNVPPTAAAQPGSVHGLVAALSAVVLSGCAANPQALCQSLVPKDWNHVAVVPVAGAGLAKYLPQPPYETNDGKPVRTVRRLWYQHGPDQLLACTLDRRATDTCSVRTTEFSRSAGGWAKVRDNEVLCHVALNHDGA